LMADRNHRDTLKLMPTAGAGEPLQNLTSHDPVSPA
jgi:hypothetical protein